jgi:hypothetical protein
MVVATFASIMWWILGFLLLGLVLYVLGTHTLSEFRIWWARQAGREHASTAAGRSPFGLQGCSGCPRGSSGSAHGADRSSHSRRVCSRD